MSIPRRRSITVPSSIVRRLPALLTTRLSSDFDPRSPWDRASIAKMDTPWCANTSQEFRVSSLLPLRPCWITRQTGCAAGLFGTERVGGDGLVAGAVGQVKRVVRAGRRDFALRHVERRSLVIRERVAIGRAGHVDDWSAPRPGRRCDGCRLVRPALVVTRTAGERDRAHDREHDERPRRVCALSS